jgi:hypothetical protein
VVALSSPEQQSGDLGVVIDNRAILGHFSPFNFSSPDVRTRTYGATVTPNTSWHYPTGTHFDVWASGPFLDGFTGSDRIVMAMAGNHVWFWLGNVRGQPALVEQLSATTYLAFGGGGVSAGGRISLIDRGFLRWLRRLLRHEVGNGIAGGRLSL